MRKTCSWIPISLLALTCLWACEDKGPKPGQMEPLTPPPGAAAKRAPADEAPKPPPAVAPAPEPEPTPEPAPVPEPETPPAPPPGSVRLRWKMPPAGVLAYRAAFTKRALTDKRQRKTIRDPLFRIPLKALFKAKRIPKKALALLARPAPKKVLDMFAVLKKGYGERLEASFYDDLGEVPSGLDGRAGQALQNMATRPSVRGEISDWGKVHTLLDADDHNSLALAFGLPEAHVLPGHVWQADVKLISPPSGFEEQGADKLNRVELIKLIPAKGGEQVALIEVLVAEQVAGIYHDGGDKLEQVYAAYFIGRGEFLVQAGRFKQFSGRLWSRAAGGKKDVEKHRALYLVHQPQVPKRFLEK